MGGDRVLPAAEDGQRHQELVMMMATVSSDSLSRQGARTEFLVPGIGFLVVAAQRTSFPRFLMEEEMKAGETA